ncbi:MAG: hypothetical protein KGQ43_10640 [Acidobacteria bacterium]|nr:hypothetical protein [Acidobacteriota bacterium]
MNPTVRTIRDRFAVVPVESKSEVHGTTKFLVTPGPIDSIRRGRVVSAGAGWLAPTGELVPLSVKEGDIVLYLGTVGTKMLSYGTEYIVLREADVLAIETAPETP